MKDNQGQPKKSQTRRQSAEGRGESKASSRAESAERMEASEQQDSPVNLPSAFAANLPPESRENLERLLTNGREFLRETRTYVKENPGEAAGLVAVGGAILWALFGTKPGRRLWEVGQPLASRFLADNISSTFNLTGRTLQ